MSKILRLGLIVGLIGFVFAPGAHAQELGVCSSWSWANPSSTNCTPASGSLDIGTTTSNPTFNIAMNGSGSTTSTDLVILVPVGSGPLTFSATFTPSGGGSAVSFTMVTAVAGVFSGKENLINFIGGTYAKGSGLSSYSFGAISGILPSPPSGFDVYLLSASSLGLTAKSGYITVTFSNFSNGTGFPIGTIFLALGDNASGVYTTKTPFTLGATTVTTVPEPMTLSLFGTGLLGIAWLTRRRMMLKDSAAEEEKGPNDSGD